MSRYLGESSQTSNVRRMMSQHVCQCVYLCVTVSMCELRHLCVEVKDTLRSLALAFHFVWTLSLFSTTVHPRLAHLSASSLCHLPHRMSVGLTAICSCVWIYVVCGDLNSSPHV